MVAYDMLVHNWSDRLERPLVHDVLVGAFVGVYDVRVHVWLQSHSHPDEVRPGGGPRTERLPNVTPTVPEGGKGTAPKV